MPPPVREREYFKEIIKSVPDQDESEVCHCFLRELKITWQWRAAIWFYWKLDESLSFDCY